MPKKVDAPRLIPQWGEGGGGAAPNSNEAKVAPRERKRKKKKNGSKEFGEHGGTGSHRKNGTKMELQKTK